MESLVISPNNKSDLDLLLKLTNKMGIDATLISDEEKEDYGLLKAMLDTDETELVSRDEIMKELRPNK